CVRLVSVFATGLAMLMPGIAGAEGEQLRGTLQTSRSGPIEGVEITVATEGGDEVATVDTDDEGRWEVDLPGPGTYEVTINADDLPDNVELTGDETQTCNVHR